MSSKDRTGGRPLGDEERRTRDKLVKDKIVREISEEMSKPLEQSPPKEPRRRQRKSKG